jgi:hypothetical protein
MGDGRTLVRTITGNSVHYVLDAEGRVVDALPGLYAPAQLTAALDASRAHLAACDDPASRTRCLALRHRDALAATRRAWERRRATRPTLPTFDTLFASTGVALAFPSALEAMPLTIGKAAIEVPMLDLIARRRTPPPPDPVEWTELLEAVETPSAAVVALVRRKTGRADAPLVAQALTRTATLDGLRNEARLHAQIHMWLADPAAVRELGPFNARVYADLFLTPSNDPWLGLRDPDVWDAIEEIH